MKKITVEILLIFTIIIPFVLGIYWIVWQAWMYVLNQFGAPDKIANPTYWTFVIAMLLFAWFASFFRSKK